jgi:UDP-2,3-diacylglucosamine pyrophosphatase LpxH
MARSVRSVFLSDLHLGTRYSRADQLLPWLAQVEPEHLYVVGDGVDTQSLGGRWHWPASHAAVVRRIVALAGRGVCVTYLLGNHDDAFRSYLGRTIGGVRLVHSATHVLADGRRVLVVHGNEHDLAVRYPVLGGMVARLLRPLDGGHRVARGVRKLLAMDHWSLAVAIRGRHPRARAMAARFRAALVQRARLAGCDGVIAGHIHIAEADTYVDRFYANAGDWVDNCTALVEDSQGRLALVDWRDRELGAIPVPTRHRGTDGGQGGSWQRGHAAARRRPGPLRPAVMGNGR